MQCRRAPTLPLLASPRKIPESLCLGGRGVSQQESCRASGTSRRGKGSMEERSKLKLSVVALSLRR